MRGRCQLQFTIRLVAELVCTGKGDILNVHFHGSGWVIKTLDVYEGLIHGSVRRTDIFDRAKESIDLIGRVLRGNLQFRFGLHGQERAHRRI